MFTRMLWYNSRMTYNTSEDALSQLLIDDKIRGRSYAEISAKHGIPIEEVIQIIRGVYAATTIRDPLEYRALLQLRMEKIIDHLWDGLMAGSFKHAEAITKAVNTLQELHDLNEKALETHINIIVDEDANKVLEVLKHFAQAQYGRLMELSLPEPVKRELEAWPEWAAESATEAVERVIYDAEIIEE